MAAGIGVALVLLLIGRGATSIGLLTLLLATFLLLSIVGAVLTAHVSSLTAQFDPRPIVISVPVPAPEFSPRVVTLPPPRMSIESALLLSSSIVFAFLALTMLRAIEFISARPRLEPGAAMFQDRATDQLAISELSVLVMPSVIAWAIATYKVAAGLSEGGGPVGLLAPLSLAIGALYATAFGRETSPALASVIGLMAYMSVSFFMLTMVVWL